MKTMMVKKENVARKWHVIDAKDKILGRLATNAACLLKGKHKVDYTPHVDMGDGVIVINVGMVKVTGNKLEQKQYKKFSGYPGGLSEEPLENILERRPTEVIRHAVKGMLPKNRLGRKMIRRLKLYTGDAHRHLAQVNVGKSKKDNKAGK